MNALRIWVLAVLAVSSFGQDKPADVDGWDQIKWGMTIADVRSVYHIAAPPESKDDWILLDLKPVKMGEVDMGVQIAARQGREKIASVRLWSHFGLASSAPRAGSQDFDTLRTLLIQKYGHPANEETKRGENFRLIRTVLWTFPSTSIVLSLEQSASLPNLGNIDLDYTARN